MLEHVRGTVISSPFVVWHLWHEGYKKEAGEIVKYMEYAEYMRYADNKEQAEKMAKEKIQQLIKADPSIYKENDFWELRISNSN